jgi:myo-inositol-1(or 4)-monophosphatase
MGGENRAVIEEFIEETLALAGAELTRRFGSRLSISTKKDASIVTDADLVLSEESGQSGPNRRPGRYIWIVDPLDGTTNFANSYPIFCVSIARGIILEDRPVRIDWAGIEDPSRKDRYIGSRGAGSRCNGAKLSVSVERPLDKCFLCTGFAYKRGEELEAEIGTFARVAAECQGIRRDGAAALDLAFVARGIYDGFWESALQPWDIAAGALLVEEAGGVVRNYGPGIGADFDPECAEVIAGNRGTVDKLGKIIGPLSRKTV